MPITGGSENGARARVASIEGRRGGGWHDRFVIAKMKEDASRGKLWESRVGRKNDEDRDSFNDEKLLKYWDSSEGP